MRIKVVQQSKSYINHAKIGGARVWCAGHSASQRGAGCTSALETDRIDPLLTTITLGV